MTAASTRPAAIFRVDASHYMGGGHVMRCLTLADRLKATGWGIRFISAAMPDNLASRLDRAGYELDILPVFPDDVDTGPHWDAAPWSEEGQRQDARQTLEILNGAPADWIIVDHYNLDHHWEEAARSAAPRFLAIDDLANRLHDCDLLLDQNLGRSAADYRSCVPARCEMLIGPQYSLLRPDFAALRDHALARRERNQHVERVLIFLGTTDVHGVTLAALESILALKPNWHIDVVLGRNAPTLPEVSRISRDCPFIDLHVDTEEMAPLMAKADLAIGAAGTTSWERCCLGLPTVTVVLASNQELIGASLHSAGAAILVPRDDTRAIARALTDLANDPPRRLQMSRSAASVTDGRGSDYVASILMTEAGQA